MNAIHTNSTLPFFAKNGAKTEYRQDLFDLYNGVISALQWRKRNGKISMITDKYAYDFYLSLGIEKVWDEVVIGIPDDFEGINPLMFWAAGKLLALRCVPCPVVMIDTDFIVWNELTFGDSIVAAHREDLVLQTYPDYECFLMKNGYQFNPKWNKQVLALNTAFLYLPDEDFKQYYIGKSLEFMKCSVDCDDFLCHMVFAEQRMLALCADELGEKVDTLMDKDKLFLPQSEFTHLWGAKQKMREQKELADNFLESCRSRIRSDFPEFSYIVDILDDYGDNICR